MKASRGVFFQTVFIFHKFILSYNPTFMSMQRKEKKDIHMDIFDAKSAVKAQIRKLFGQRTVEKILGVILSTQQCSRAGKVLISVCLSVRSCSRTPDHTLPLQNALKSWKIGKGRDVVVMS